MSMYHSQHHAIMMSRTTTIAGCSSSDGITGYDYEFVCEQTTLQEYVCLICRFVAREPLQLSCCGKTICDSCWQQYLAINRSGNKCPHCKQAITSHTKTVFSDKKTYQKIISLPVRCSFSQKGCDWVGELGSFESCHRHSCKHQVQACSECDEEVPKIDMEDHKCNKCRKRQVKCPFCPCINTYEYVYEEHKPLCRFWEVECPNGCGMNIPQGSIEDHRKFCTLQMVPCRYSKYGCQVIVIRQDLEIHEIECPKKCNQTRDWIQKREENLVAPLQLAFDNFKEYLKTNQAWESQSFYVGEGYRMCMRVYPNGCGQSSNEEYLSCYILLQSGSFDENLRWPFQGVVTICIKNQVEDNNHFVKHIKFLSSHSTPCNCKPKSGQGNDFGLGDPQFISHIDLRDGDPSNKIQYLKEDKIIFHIHCEVQNIL